MSFIDHLPPEILSTVFLHVLPPFDALENPEHVPSLLSQVCRPWRTLALALPALWASLNITCNQTILHPPLKIIHVHLQRSAAYPLSIVLDTNHEGDLWPVLNPHFSIVLAALAAERNRWRYVSIMLGEDAMQETLDAITQGDAPLLQSFSLNMEGYLSLNAPPIPLCTLQGWTRLESLAWSSSYAPLGPGLGDETWLQLTTLHLEASLTTSDCLTLLQISPRLSTAEFRAINSSNTTPPRHFLHARLCILRARGRGVAVLIDALTLPALVDLNLDVPTSRPARHHAALPAFLARSMPPLRVLALTQLHLPEAVLLHTLALADGLHALSITDFDLARVSLSTVLIHALHPSPPPAQHPLCPRLVRLRLAQLNVTGGACTAMLRARWGAAARRNGVAGLQRVYIEMEGDEREHERDYAEMRAMNAEGFVGSLARPRHSRLPLPI